MSDTMWTNAINQMISAINSDNNMRDFFIQVTPDKDKGYAWYQSPEYRYYTSILEQKTDSSGHSGASFSCCLRESVNRIRKEIVVVAETHTSEEDIITLEPIS